MTSGRRGRPNVRARPGHQEVGTGVSILGLLVAILGGVGELLGWWNEIGELMVSTGTIVGAVAGIFILFEGASQQTVEATHHTVEDNNELVRESNTKLETLDDVRYELDRQTGVLEDIRDRV